MTQLWKNYNLSIVLFALFVASWIAQAVFQVGIEGESWGAFFAEMFANWESEFLQLFFQVLLPVYLVHRNSPVSRDSDDRLERKLDLLLQRGNHHPPLSPSIPWEDEEANDHDDD